MLNDCCNCLVVDFKSTKMNGETIRSRACLGV